MRKKIKKEHLNKESVVGNGFTWAHSFLILSSKKQFFKRKNYFRLFERTHYLAHSIKKTKKQLYFWHTP